MSRWPLRLQSFWYQRFRITKQPIINSNRRRFEIAIAHNFKIENRGKDYGNLRLEAGVLQYHWADKKARQKNTCRQSRQAWRWNDWFNRRFSVKKANESQPIACSDWWNITTLRQSR